MRIGRYLCVGKARKTASLLCGQAHMHQINWSRRDRSMCRRRCSLQTLSNWASRPYQCQTKRFPCHVASTSAAFAVNWRHSWSNPFVLSAIYLVDCLSTWFGLKTGHKTNFRRKTKINTTFLSHWKLNYFFSFRSRSPFVRYSVRRFSHRSLLRNRFIRPTHLRLHKVLTRAPSSSLSVDVCRSHALHMRLESPNEL